MWFQLSWVALVSVLVTGLQQAPTKSQKEPPKPPQVEVRFADGSTVRMTVLQENLEILTRYGRLTVPIHEVRRLELGMHMPDGVAERIDAAIRKLGSTAFREREDASQELIALGGYSYSAVVTATKSQDQEVALRANEVIKKLRERIPADQLRLNPQDRIQTAEFPIAGKLVSPMIRARNAYFGDIQLKLSELRSIRWMGGSGESELLVDASKHGSPGSPWFDTGVDVEGDGGVLIAASGQVDLWPATPGQYTTGPTGYRNAGTVQGSSHHAGTLLGKVGENGKVFVVGDRFDATLNQEGRLFLTIAPSPWNNAAGGSYAVRISGRAR